MAVVVPLRGIVWLIVWAAVPHTANAQYARTRPRPVPGAVSPDLSVHKGLVVTFRGVLKQLKKNTILIESDDQQLITVRRSRATKFWNKDQEIKATDIDLETPVAIEASEDSDLRMVAIKVNVLGKAQSFPR